MSKYISGHMSKFFYTDKPILGLDISSTGIKLMSVDPKKWLVSGYGSIDLDPLKAKEAIEDESSTFLADNLKELMANKINGSLTSNVVAIAVPTARSYTRTFTLPTSAEKNLDEAVILKLSNTSLSLFQHYILITRSSSAIEKPLSYS